MVVNEIQFKIPVLLLHSLLYLKFRSDFPTVNDKLLYLKFHFDFPPLSKNHPEFQRVQFKAVNKTRLTFRLKEYLYCPYQVPISQTCLVGTGTYRGKSLHYTHPHVTHHVTRAARCTCKIPAFP